MTPDTWTDAVIILCKFFDLDLTTKSGLKKIYGNFDAVYKKLDGAYKQYPDHDKIRGGVVGIYSKMSVDSLLRNKLFERGLLDKLIPLLDDEKTRHMALRALTTITTHGGADVRTSIALHSEALCKLVDECPEEHLVYDLVLSILSHCVGAAVEGNEKSPTYPKVLKKLNMSRILNTVVHCITRPFACATCIDHGTDLIASATLQASAAYKNAPEATKILIAGLRAGNWSMRALCLGALLRLHKEGAEEDVRQLDPKILTSPAMHSMPGELQDAMMDYGLPQCDLYSILHYQRDFMQAIMAYPQDFNLHALGMKLYKIILGTEFAIPDGYYETMNERTGRPERLDIPGMAFQRYPDALPACARALRERGRPEEQDAANVLDIKFKIMRQRIPEAVEQANRAIEANPNYAYYYYAVSLSADHVNGLKAAKKGIKCTKGTSPFVKFQLMQRAVEHAAEIGLEKLQNMEARGEKWEVGVAFLNSALGDARTYLAEAPPDARAMKNVAYWFVLLTVVVSETVSLDLREVQPALEPLRVADTFARHLKMGPPKTVHRLTKETVMKLYKDSVTKYSELFERATGGKAVPEVSQEKLEDDLAAWLDDLHLEDGCENAEPGHKHNHASDEPKKSRPFRPIINANTVAMYQCSHCGNPSASLRKCSRCEKARYCDSACQKAAWSSHKKVCGTK